MFESSLLSSSGSRRRGSRAILASLLTQAVVCAVVLVAPLFRPQALPAVHAQLAPVQLMPQPRIVKPELPKSVPLPHQAATSAVQAPAPQQIATLRLSGTMQRAPSANVGNDAPLVALGNGMSDKFTLGTGPGDPAGLSRGPQPVVRAAEPVAKSPTSIRVSKGVSQGLLLAPIRPTYPPIAIAAHVQGVVELTATIDKQGRIINLTVTDGPVMLRQAAIAAVSQARYRPYLLNGEPTEVTTTISVNFRMDAGS